MYELVEIYSQIVYATPEKDSINYFDHVTIHPIHAKIDQNIFLQFHSYARLEPGFVLILSLNFLTEEKQKIFSIF